MRQSTKIHSTTRGFHAFLPCRAAVVAGDPPLRSRDHPPAPEVDWLAARNFSIVGVPAGSSARGYRALVAARRAVCTMAKRGFPGSELVAITTGIVPARMPKKICRHAEPSQ